MFRKMRRRDRLMGKEESVMLLTKAEYGVLSTVTEDDYPYGVPVHYAYNDNDNVIYIHCAPEGHKLDSIQKNPKVSFCVVGPTEVVPEEFTANYTSVIVFGNAEVIKDDKKRDALIMILEKYSRENVSKGKNLITKAGDDVTVIKITIEHMTGKRRNRV